MNHGTSSCKEKMKNSFIQITKQWQIIRDEFYEIDPLDNSIDEEKKYNDLFCQEDLLWVQKSDFNIDLGWYGEEEKGYFGLYLYKGIDWHNCQLLEKRNTKDYESIVESINRLIKNVDTGRYHKVDNKLCSIDDYYETEIISVLNE